MSFCSFKFVWFPWEALMDVTHHKSERTFKQCSVLKETLHVVNAAWEDLEQEGHIARTFNLWTQGLHTPPIMLSVPDIIARVNYYLSFRMMLQITRMHWSW